MADSAPRKSLDLDSIMIGIEEYLNDVDSSVGEEIKVNIARDEDESPVENLANEEELLGDEDSNGSFVIEEQKNEDKNIAAEAKEKNQTAVEGERNIAAEAKEKELAAAEDEKNTAVETKKSHTAAEAKEKNRAALVAEKKNLTAPEDEKNITTDAKEKKLTAAEDRKNTAAETEKSQTPAESQEKNRTAAEDEMNQTSADAETTITTEAEKKKLTAAEDEKNITIEAEKNLTAAETVAGDKTPKAARALEEETDSQMNKGPIVADERESSRTAAVKTLAPDPDPVDSEIVTEETTCSGTSSKVIVHDIDGAENAMPDAEAEKDDPKEAGKTIAADKNAPKVATDEAVPVETALRKIAAEDNDESLRPPHIDSKGHAASTTEKDASKTPAVSAQESAAEIEAAEKPGTERPAASVETAQRQAILDQETEELLKQLELMEGNKASNESSHAQIRAFNETQPIYIYTSLAGGGFHMMPRTNRLATILTANRVAFEYRDLGTDPEARSVWRSFSAGKSLPGVVRGRDDVIGNWQDIDDANEQYALRDLLYSSL